MGDGGIETKEPAVLFLRSRHNNIGQWGVPKITKSRMDRGRDNKCGRLRQKHMHANIILGIFKQPQHQSKQTIAKSAMRNDTPHMLVVRDSSSIEI